MPRRYHATPAQLEALAKARRARARKLREERRLATVHPRRRAVLY